MGFMGKESLWKNKYFGAFITHLGAYPVNRGAPDRESLRRTLELLESGKPLVLFPEGTRRSGPVIEHLHEGAAYVASQAGVPLVPVGIGGSERALPKGKALPRLVRIHVLVGEPLVPPPIAEGARHPSRRAVKEFTVQLQNVLQDLFDRAQRTAGVEVPVNQTAAAGRVTGVREDGSFEAAFDELFPRAVRLANRLLGDRAAAEDVAAEALARAYARWPKVGGLPYRDGWVLKVATNLAIDRLRRRPPEMWPPTAATSRTRSSCGSPSTPPC